MDKTSAGTLPVRTKLLYGVGDVGNALVNSAIQFFLLKFYTDGALILPALASSALLIGKIWDAINDPLMGWLTDRSTHRLGKRRVFMLFGAVPLGISVALLWFVPAGMPALWTFVWIALTFTLFDTLWTLTNVPYYALTSELTENYDERSSLTAYRMVMAVPAYLVGAAITPAIVGAFAIQRTGYAAIGIIYGVLAALALLGGAFGIRERKTPTPETASRSKPLESLKIALRNKPFVRLLAAYIILNMAFALIKTLMAYFLQYQLDMAAETTLVMGLLLICVTLSLFVWKKISERLDKGPSYAIGMLIGALAGSFMFFLPNAKTALVYPIAALAGFSLSGVQAVSRTMVSQLSPATKTAEFYGFLSVAGRTSAFIGPWVFGSMYAGFTNFYLKQGLSETVAKSNGILWGIGSIVVFLIVGLLFLTLVRRVTSKDPLKFDVE